MGYLTLLGPTRMLAFWGAFVALLAFGVCTPGPAMAARKSHHTAPALRGSDVQPAKAMTRSKARKTARRGNANARRLAGATDPAKDAALIVDGNSGKVLYARNETALRHPASLTKMMTLYLLFDALRGRRITMDTQMPVSAHAARQKPTKLNLRPGQTINVDTAIRAIVIRSANDVAVVIAEALGGTEAHFGEMMTAKARQLGMKDTNYHNASGLPDPLQITTATDLAVLAHHVAYDFPQYYSYFGLPGFTYKGVYYPTHDNLVGRYQGTDGIKTGYTGASGFNLASSVVRGGVHLIGIVMGGRTAVRRDQEMMHLLDLQFAQVSANPGLVAKAPVPWQTVASAAATPRLAGMDFAPPGGNKFAALSPLPSAVDDEDAAEARRAPDENFNVIHAEAPQPLVEQPRSTPAVPAVPPLLSRVPAPAIRPTARPDFTPAPAIASASPAMRPQARPQMPEDKSQQVALFQPAPKPAAHTPPSAPALRTDVGEGDVDQPGTTVPGRNWTIQIGAYADQALAKAQLASYALKAQDVLGRAARIVAPIQSDGHTLYRARFGLYAEREARQVCDRLTQRGQTCFAAVATR